MLLTDTFIYLFIHSELSDPYSPGHIWWEELGSSQGKLKTLRRLLAGLLLHMAGEPTDTMFTHITHYAYP